MMKVPGKINNSYEDESISSSTSSHESSSTDHSTSVLTDLKPISPLSAPIIIQPVVNNEDPENILNHIYKTRNILIEKTKNLSPNKLIKKEPPPLLSEIVTENSSNAVDIVDVRPLEVDYLRNEELTFNGRIGNILNNQIAATTSKNEASLVPKSSTTKSNDVDSLEESKRMLAHDTSHMMLTNERSPDLFETDDNDYEDTREKNDEYTIDTEISNEKESIKDTSCTKSANLSSHETSASGFDTISRINADEERFLNKLQLSLTGVLPPPSITISQINIAKMIQLYNDNAKLMGEETEKSFGHQSENACEQKYSYFSTHTVDEAKDVPWPELLNIKAHGIHYNRSKYSEKIEMLSLKYVDRYIGAETSSSFAVLQSPSSAKKRNMRLKMLRKSPGNRLSYLARRREVFSSEHLAGQSSKSGGGSASLFGLGRKQQIMVNSGKAGLKNSRKIKTPKRYTPSRRLTPSSRKTPNSKKKASLKKISGRPGEQVLQRENSKRALFQSPTVQPEPTNVVQVTPEVANRAQKSKRVLFSPEKLPRSMSFGGTVNENALRPSVRHNSLLYLNEINDNVINCNLKRKRDSENNENLIDQKLSLAERQKLTPNSLKMIKSLSFCGKSESRDNVNINLLGSCNRNLMFRSTSEIIPGSSAASSQSQLTEIHRKKLLWAVSHALQLKQITVKHEKFKQYAASLARVTKRLYLEYEQNTPGSTSEKMMKLTSRLVFYVMQDKTVDEIYEIESQNMEKNIKNRLEKSNSFQIYNGGNNLNKTVL